MIKVCTASEKETVEIGRMLGMLLAGGEVIALNGELGAGKTAFTKGIAMGLGISEYITSPTFALVNEYEGRVPLYHFDVYRINDEDELIEIGFEDYIYGNGVSVVEWSSLTPHIMPGTRVEVSIEKVSGDVEKRSICFSFLGDKNIQLEKKFTEEVLKYENSRS
jgi:tRNA threonylcarbamoyladenosine biosynthesis protein TsaE